MPEKFSASAEQWQESEKKVDEAEKKVRRAGKAKQRAAKAGPSLARRSAESAQALQDEVGAVLGPEDSPERALVGLRRKNLVAAVRNDRTLAQERQSLLDEEADMLAEMEGQATMEELEALDEIRAKLKANEAAKTELLSSNPEAFFGLHLKDMKEYKEDLATGRIVETPYVKRQAEDVVAHLRANKPVLLYGHLGTGKTELAMHVAKEYIGKEALVISGSKHTSLAELYGHQILAVDKMRKADIDDFLKEVEQKYAAWLTEHDQADEGEKSRAHDRILQTYLAQKKGGTISDFFLGPIYRAMEEGRPVIIDEVNAIPHEVLISLNHILTRKVGETVDVQQDSGRKVKVAEGFGVIMTGNLNQGDERYVDRQDLDPAFLSRVYKLEHDYLPQQVEGALEDEAGPENELFQLLLARVMDRNGNLAAPEDAVRKLWRLAQAARVSQDVFAGKQVKDAYYFRSEGGRPVQYMLKESVLSLRALDAVMARWTQDGYRRELDYYLWKEFVKQSTNAADRAYLYQLCKDQFGFFTGDGWPQNPGYGTGGVVRSFDLAAPENPAGKAVFFGPRQVIEAAYGKAPERAAWPETEESEMVPEAGQKALELGEWREAFRELMDRIEKDVGAACSVS